MEFWLQKCNGELEIDTRILRDELDRQKFVHQYKILDMDEMDDMIRNLSVESALRIIPVGSLEFVGKFLKRVHGVERMEPVEVPEMLRKADFLKRHYAIVEADDVPRAGRFFVKDASVLKAFSYAGNLEHLTEEERKKYIRPERRYQVSEMVDIVSEYRCFVHDDRLVAVNYYGGDCSVFPDANIIRSMIGTYMLDDSRPAAYTLDVAVLKNRGTAILEVHPWVSVGLYGYMFGSELPYCYRDGFRYYVEKGKKTQKFQKERKI